MYSYGIGKEGLLLRERARTTGSECFSNNVSLPVNMVDAAIFTHDYLSCQQWNVDDQHVVIRAARAEGISEQVC